MKNKITINGKVFEEVSSSPVQDEATPAAEVTPEVSEELVDEAAQKILKSLGLDEIRQSVADMQAAVKSNSAHETKSKALIDLAQVMKKDVNSLTTSEKIIGFFQAMVQNNQTVLKALSEGTAADGGYLFPDEFVGEVVRDLSNEMYMRNEVTVVPMKRDILKVPTLASGPKVTWTAENAAKSTTTAHFNEATLTVKKMAAIMYISDELVEDSTSIDIVQFIVKLFSEAIGTEEDRVITAGNGTTEPTGYNVASGPGTRTCSGNLSFDNLTDLEYDLPAKYHRNAKWYMHRNNIRECRKLKDSQNRPLWADPVSASLSPTLHGYPVIEDNNLPESTIVFGDLKQAYWLGDRKSLTVKVTQDTETAFVHDQTAVRVVSRIAGNVVNPFAIKKLVSIP
jgi:HK97 family phage major capsid protein